MFGIKKGGLVPKSANFPDSAKTKKRHQVLMKFKREVPARFHEIAPAESFPAGDGIFIHGVAGSGKTYKAAQLYYWYLLEHGTALCYYYRAEDLVYALRRDQDRDNRPRHTDMLGEIIIAAPLMERLLRARLLVIDDLSDDGMTEWACSKFNHIINSRYDDLLPTIITTNLSIEEIETMSKRMGSRIRGFVSIAFEDSHNG